MSRKINQPARAVALVPDPRHGLRPHRIRWQDRLGYEHEVVAVGVQDEWLDADWDPNTMQVQQRRYWRLLLPAGGLVTLYQDLNRSPGQAGHWVVERVED